MENTAIQHTSMKFDQNKKNPEPHIKQKTPRSSEKTLAVATLFLMWVFWNKQQHFLLTLYMIITKQSHRSTCVLP